MGDKLLLEDLCDGGYFQNFDLFEESTASGKGLVKFRGKFQEANKINKNKRMYTRNILDSNMNRLIETIKSRGLIGELDHPSDSIIHFENASHLITNLWWDNDVLMGEGQILNTPNGNLLKALINDDVRIGISSRGVGSGKTNENGVLVIGESYRLITFDAVADPSTNEAYQERVVNNNNKRESVAVSQNYHNIDNVAAKNEGSCIDTVNKEILLACLGGIISSKTNDIKARLG